jgi:hypothetical protein
MDGSNRYLSSTVNSVVDLIRVRQAFLKCSNRFRKSVGKPMDQIQNVGIVYHGKSRQYMTKPRLLAFLHEHVPTVLGFFHFRLLSILQYLPTVCRSIQQPFASPHPQTSMYFQISGDTRRTRPSINKVACRACLSSCMYLYFTSNRMHREAYDPALQAACSTASVSRMPRNKARSQSSAG